MERFKSEYQPLQSRVAATIFAAFRVDMGFSDSSSSVRREGEGGGAGLLGRRVASQRGPGSELECIMRESDWNLRTEEGGRRG